MVPRVTRLTAATPRRTTAALPLAPPLRVVATLWGIGLRSRRLLSSASVAPSSQTPGMPETLAENGSASNVARPLSDYSLREEGMPRYANLGGDSGVVAYETTEDSIIVEFQDGSAYLYTYSSAGRSNIEQMKALAERGEGLNEFINRHVRKAYARKIR